MKAVLGMLAVLLLAFAGAFAQQTATQERPLAITHVTVIDTTGGPEQRDQTVLVEGDRIAAVGKAGSVRIPRGALVSNAAGKFLIPGLWEMHTHAFIRSRKSFPLYVMYLFLANGVTGARDMGSPGERDDFGDYPY